MRFDATTNERVLKLVYSGPGLSGKTTNLNGLRSVFPNLAGDLTAVDLHSERTLRLDLVVAEPLATAASPTRLEILTVPGQNYYAATRKAVLDGADGVVFVADSRREALDENIEAMNEMLNNMRQLGLGDDLPVVVQYNKQDLPTAVKREQIEPLMNVRGWPSFAGIAIQGNGVADALRAVVGAMLARMPAASEPTVAAPATWLISCYRCQAMLEVPDARIGTIYTCGVCNASMEVTDTDRGLTRPPENAPRDDSAYSLQTLPDQNQGALATGERTPATQMPGLPSEPAFILPGYVIANQLDENVQGQRMRVKDASGRTQRALVLNAPLMRQPGFKDGLDAYVRLAGQVKHPFILPMTGMTQIGENAVFLSNDPPDYEPLSVILARRRALAPPHAMGILRQLALALEEAARHGVVHGWLRPDVVLVNPDGAVLLDELCVPKAHRYLIRELSGPSAATEYYLAPEHLGEEARGNIRSDMFVMGSMLFRMLTGEGLVTGYNAHDALHKVATNGARTLRSVQPGISRDLDQFFQKLVAVDRKDRFQNYHELVDLFDRFGGGAQRQSLQLTHRTGAQRPGNRLGTPGGHIPPPKTPAHGRAAIPGPQARGATAGAALPRSGTAEFRRPTGNTGPIRRTTTLGGGAGNQPRPSSGQNWKTQSPAPSGSSLGLTLFLLLLFAALAGAAVWYLVTQRQVMAPTPVTPSEPLEAPRPAAPTTTSRPKPPMPGWMTPAPAAPVAPASAQPAAAAAPAVDGVTTRIAALVKEERFQEALTLAEQIPQAERRRQAKDGIIDHHDRRRQAIETALDAAPDMLTVRNLLAAPGQVWGLPGDNAWAQAQAQRLERKLTAGQPAAQPQTAPLATSSTTPVQQTAARIDPHAQSYALVVQNLANGQPLLAQQVVAGMDPAHPEAGALRALIGAWSLRASQLNRAVSERGQRLRIPHPLTGQGAEITRLDDQKLTLTARDGSTLEVGWGKVPLKEQIRLCVEVADAPGARSDDLALAVGMLLIGNDPLLASVQLKQSRSGLEVEAVRQLDLLLGLGRRGEIAGLLARANAAIEAGNGKAVTEIIDQLKRADLGLMPNLPEEIQRLEAQRDRLAAARASSTSPDRITFSSQDDLRAFTDVTGTWQVVNGAALNTGEARLGRRDGATARTLQISFMPQASKGALAVDFRGIRLVIDLGTGSWQMASRRESAPSAPIAVIPRTVNTLLIDYRAADNLVRAELNNGTQAIAVHIDTPTDALFIAALGGAAVAIDEIAITRTTSRPTAPIGSQASLRQLGWEPLGDAALDPPVILLPARATPPRSGIAMPLRDNLAGLSFEVKGTGMLRVNLGKPDGTGQWVDVELAGPATALNVRVAWGGGTMSVADDTGRTIGSTPVTTPPTHVIISALQDATILSTPRPVIK